jgi:starch synthase (maltosyl-transferring)
LDAICGDEVKAAKHGKEECLKPKEGRSRVIIEQIEPQVDCGRHAIKRIAGDRVSITAVMYADGHDHVAARLLYRKASEHTWRSAPFLERGNDVWEAQFTVDDIGQWFYTVQAWVDHFGTWIHDLHKRIDAQSSSSSTTEITGGPEQNEGTAAADENTVALEDFVAPKKPRTTAGPARPESDIALAFRTGAILLDQASARSREKNAQMLKGAASSLRYLAEKNATTYEFPLGDEMIRLALQYPDLSYATTYATEFPLWVDRKRARFSSWYEFFPRSCGKAGQHGTLRDAATMLPRVAEMGFDVVYFPPIHPIGTAFRKGKNNSIFAEADDVGSPWAIGNVEGGHKAILRELGTFEDFATLVESAKKLDMEIALDIAFQCAPDHPWVKEHPNWFKIRPDGSIQYAENPPKKYQDIYPINFESSDWRALWQELCSVFTFWIHKGVRIFRVDNPHTKAIPFWEWCITEIHKQHPDVLFLAEAFTRPHVMYGLAKIGYTQSYTYFSWRTEKQELTQYMQEITTPPVSEFFRPNLWPNTPDILVEFLQEGGRAAFMQRVILAATLSASYGIYGPAYELCEHIPAKPRSEEYMDSEKYQLREWDLDNPISIAPLITLLNRIRRAHPSLQTNDKLHFHGISNDHLIAYSKRSGDDVLLTIVNLDPYNVQTGWTDLQLMDLGMPLAGEYEAHDLLSGETYLWQGSYNYVSLDPGTMPAHILLLHPQHLSEHTAAESTED